MKQYKHYICKLSAAFSLEEVIVITNHIFLLQFVCIYIFSAHRSCSKSSAMLVNLILINLRSGKPLEVALSNSCPFMLAALWTHENLSVFSSNLDGCTFFFIPTFCFYDTESLQKDHDSWQCTSKLNVSHEKIRYFRQTIYSESMQMVWNFFGEVNNILFTK